MSKRPSMRIGYGFDSHAFKPGVPLVIGGLKIEHPEGLAGHSDGDVLLHAITDSLLGAVSAGDIGSFFPPSDPRWKNADSAIFLATALTCLMAGCWPPGRGWSRVAPFPEHGPKSCRRKPYCKDASHKTPRIPSRRKSAQTF